jgi:hypothetical protein
VAQVVEITPVWIGQIVAWISYDGSTMRKLLPVAVLLSFLLMALTMLGAT